MINISNSAQEGGLIIVINGTAKKKYEVDSTAKPHLHNGFSESWESCLNLCSWRWLRPRWSLVRNLIPCGLWHLNTLFGEGLRNFSMVLLSFADYFAVF